MAEPQRQRRDQTLDELLEHASGLPTPAAREEFLRELALEDPALASEVGALLSYSPGAGGMIQTIFSRGLAHVSPDAAVADERFGAYRVVRHIASGGMGSVFEAVRGEDFQKRVAIKVASTPVSTNFWTEQVKRERQILAGLDHPNIAKLLDGGSTADGRPYLVIEYVEGEPLTQYAQTHSLPLRAKIELFLKVCAAVSFAHRNLVVHRDLKPGNIHVTKSGEPMLLDFGLAKLISSLEVAAGGDTTKTPAAFLTPDFCTSEQLNGAQVTTRTDVCQLGLLLSQLMTGRPPRDWKSPSSIGELVAAVCDTPVPPPSTRDPHLTQDLAGDLDSIVLKATQIDPDLRYESVDALAHDLQRWLGGLPVEARHPTFAYRAGKLLRRRWKLFTALAVVSVVAIGAGIAYIRESRVSARRFETTRALAREMLFDEYDKLQSVPGTAELRDRLATTALQYLNELSEGGSISTDLRAELVEGYAKLAFLRSGELVDLRKSGEAAERGLALVPGLSPEIRKQHRDAEQALLAIRGQSRFDASRSDEGFADLTAALQLAHCEPGNIAACRLMMTVIEGLLLRNIQYSRHDACEPLLKRIQTLPASFDPSGKRLEARILRMVAAVQEMHLRSARKQTTAVVDAALRYRSIADQLAPEAASIEISDHRALCLYYETAVRYIAMSDIRPPGGIDLAVMADTGWLLHEQLLQRDAKYIRHYHMLADMARFKADAYADTPSRRHLAGSLYEKALDIAIANLRDKQLVNQIVDLYDSAVNAIYYYLFTRHDIPAARAVAVRIAGIIDLNMAVRIHLPRTSAAGRRLQGLWWLAHLSRTDGYRDWGVLAREAAAAAEQQLESQDPYTLAVAAYALDEFGAGPGEKEKATRAWKQVLAALPEHDWIERRVKAGPQ